MYLPSHFAQNDRPTLHALIRDHPLAALVTQGPDGPTADHVPLELDASVGEHCMLRGHVARANPLWQRAEGQRVLAIFQGPQAYVTPSWYATKAQTHQVVPTWNYAVVHAHGVLQVVHEAPWLHALVSGLTRHHEAPRAQPWAVADAPGDFVQNLLRAIVGIQIPLTQVVGKFKLSQNRNEADRHGVVNGLAAGTAEEQNLAHLMRHHPPETS